MPAPDSAAVAKLHDDEPTPAPTSIEQLASERTLLVRFAESPSPEVREELIRRFMPLARRLASKYAGRPEPFEDLVQVASLGLVKAVDRFDPGRGTAFSTFAVPTILGELRRHFRDRGWAIRIPRGLQELSLKVDREMERLPTKLWRAPTVADVAVSLGVEEEAVLEAMHAGQGHHSKSLDDGGMLDGEESIPMIERLGEEDGRFDTVEWGADIAPALADVDDREREILRLRFVEDLTQGEIAERIGVSQMHVSRLLRATLEELRERSGA